MNFQIQMYEGWSDQLLTGDDSGLNTLITAFNFKIWLHLKTKITYNRFFYNKTLNFAVLLNKSLKVTIDYSLCCVDFKMK